MNKDYNQKDEMGLNAANLRGKINGTIKSLRDQGEETKQPQSKTLPFIPVTGGKTHKYFDNKSREEL